MMSGIFNLSTGELDVGTGLVLAPDRTTVADVTGAGSKALDARNGWESFSTDEIIIWRHSFAVSAHFYEGRFAAIDCLRNDGSIRNRTGRRLMTTWSAKKRPWQN
jgi:hypothetical protein